MADILIIDDQDRYAELCRRAMPEHRYRGPVRSFRDAAEALGRARGRVDLVLLDVHFDIPDEDLLGFEPGAGPKQLDRLRRTQGLLILQEIRSRYPDLPVILMTSREDVRLEEEDLDSIEYTFFLDDDYVDARSLATLIRGVEDQLRGRESEGPIFWGRSLAMRQIRRRLEVLALGRLPVVLFGPTGTGKSLLARHFVHPRSGRAGQFISVDLATLPQELIAAHLFGSVRGAYTGSVGDRVGAFEAANGGTLFLDEIGNLSPEAQKMLLSVLQEGRVSRLGDLKERSVDVKLVVATNEDLKKRVREGSFRADLYMRLNPAAAVHLPPLRDRGHDLERLIGHAMERALSSPAMAGLLATYRSRHRVQGDAVRVHAGPDVPDDVPGSVLFLFPERSVRLLRAHSWPGNLREFAMTVENAVLFALGELIDAPRTGRSDVVQVRPKLVRDLLSHSPGADPLDEAQGEADTATEQGGWPVKVHVRQASTLNKVAQDCERQYFTRLYLRTRGDFSAMADLLLGDEEHARKVQLRFNQLGLKVRELKELLR
ncbi:MAG: sigma-54-dependent Fis family transcriptional regulator [Proteobacteria bacterium]|nr:sigma-54-dependent Fis family transcriptional regulator [Pseudomonadota bacterium]